MDTNPLDGLPVGVHWHGGDPVIPSYTQRADWLSEPFPPIFNERDIEARIADVFERYGRLDPRPDVDHILAAYPHWNR